MIEWQVVRDAGCGRKIRIIDHPRKDRSCQLLA
jgi:hypothetical protein